MADRRLDRPHHEYIRKAKLRARYGRDLDDDRVAELFARIRADFNIHPDEGGPEYSNLRFLLTLSMIDMGDLYPQGESA